MHRHSFAQGLLNGTAISLGLWYGIIWSVQQMLGN
jgi:hypothetical protein